MLCATRVPAVQEVGSRQEVQIQWAATDHIKLIILHGSHSHLLQTQLFLPILAIHSVLTSTTRTLAPALQAAHGQVDSRYHKWTTG
jgi:hypothetical protein